MSDKERLGYSPAEVAELLGISDKQVRGLIHARKLRARATGKRYIIPVKALDEFLDGADDPMVSAS